jgi:hypothetical protein
MDLQEAAGLIISPALNRRALAHFSAHHVCWIVFTADADADVDE